MSTWKESPRKLLVLETPMAQEISFKLSPSFTPVQSQSYSIPLSVQVGKVPGPRKSILSKNNIRKSLKLSAITNKRLFSQSLLRTPNNSQHRPNTFTIPNKPMSKALRRSVRFDDTINIATYEEFLAPIRIKQRSSLPARTSIQSRHKCDKCSNS